MTRVKKYWTKRNGKWVPVSSHKRRPRVYHNVEPIDFLYDKPRRLYKAERMIVGVTGAILGIVITYGLSVKAMQPREVEERTVYQTETKEKTVLIKDETPEPLPPVLIRIARCESGGRQFDKHGKVIIGKVNSNDRGMFQINRKIWGKDAKALGYDIETEEGNTAMALHLYATLGTEPWIWSKPCWLK